MSLEEREIIKELSDEIRMTVKDALAELGHLWAEIRPKFGISKEAQYQELRQTKIDRLTILYQRTRQIALALWCKNPRGLPELPESKGDPIIDLQNLQQWCLRTNCIETNTDLASTKPVETQQNTVLMKCWRFIKKVVEKGWKIFTKSFWEAVFDRMWPK